MTAPDRCHGVRCSTQARVRGHHVLVTRRVRTQVARPGWLETAWVCLLGLLLLGPALAPGFVLSYDMVWVPDLALTRDALGVASGLPRAVPSDAVVAVLDEVVPAVLLQKLVLVGAVVGGGLGLVRLLPADAVVPRLVAGAAYTWNPLVVERLVIGHWPLLLGYAVAPWLVLAARRWHRTGAVPAALWWLVPLGSLSASTGLVTGVLLVALAARREVRRWALLGALLLLANLPWVAAGLLHAGSATSAASAAARFALHGEGPVPAPVAALTLGGIWNSEVVPASRAGLLGWLAALVLVPLAAAGLGRLRVQLGERTWWGLVACWTAGWVGACLTWLAPGAVGAVAAAVPGGGVLRDGARLLVLCAPLLCLALGAGAGRLLERVPEPARVGTALGVLALPLALLPGVAWGVGGALRAVDYPDDHAAARAVVQQQQPEGDTVLLPFSSYRAPAWNGGRKVLDPTGRYLGVDVVQDDTLAVSGRLLPGEDPRASQVREVLEGGNPRSRAEDLAALGVGAVVLELGAGESAAVAGEPWHRGAELVVLGLRDVDPVETPRSWGVVMGVAWTAFVAGPLLGAGLALRRTTRPPGGRRGGSDA